MSGFLGPVRQEGLGIGPERSRGSGLELHLFTEESVFRFHGDEDVHSNFLQGGLLK